MLRVTLLSKRHVTISRKSKARQFQFLFSRKLTRVNMIINPPPNRFFLFKFLSSFDES